MTEPTSETVSAGALLRAARERQGLHIAALAAAIKVAPRKLDALEHNRWSELPDATFTRALAQTVCRALKTDPAPVLALLPAQEVAVLEPGGGSGLGEPFYDGSERGASGLGAVAIRPMVLGALALMVAAAGLYFVPPQWLTPAAPVALAPVATPASVLEAASAPVVAVAASVQDFVASEPAPAAAGSALPSPVATPAPTAVTAAAAGSAAQPARPDAPVQLHASAASWVEARDARGQVLLSRIVRAGEQVGIEGAPPLRLTIGNALGTRLSFRGQAVDLASRTRDNVARVELP